MTDLTISKDNNAVSYIKNVTFFYVKMKDAVDNYNKDGLEYAVDVAVDRDTYDEFLAEFPKTSNKKIKTSEWEEKYKTDPVYPDEKFQYVLKFKTQATYQDGSLVPYKQRPKVVEVMEDGTRVDVTLDKLVSNGSTGDVAVRTKVYKKGGSSSAFAKLAGILVTNLIEYAQSASSDPFGDVQGPSAEAIAAAEAPRPTAKQEEPEEEFSEDDIPF